MRVQDENGNWVDPRATKASPICPRCSNDMERHGSVGVVHNDGEWDAETERFDCPDGHTILVLDTDRIDEVEGYEKVEGHGLNFTGCLSTSKLCETCRVVGHDTCSMTDGCACCDETKRQLSS